MYEEYVKDIKELKLEEKTEEESNIELIKSIIKTKMDLDNANKNYEFVEGELVDYYLYQIKANQSKLNYLIRKAKKNGIIIDMIKQIEIRRNQILEDTNAV